MKLIVGLGNPGKEYKNTRHNVGFVVIDKIQKNKLKNNKRFKAEMLETNIKGERVILIKPTTYMNLSGEAVKKIADYYKIKDEDIWIICDDVNLPIGKIRVRKKGSDGGHNGLKSIIDNLSSVKFARIRVGIANEKNDKISLEKYVLSNPNKDEGLKLEKSIDKTADLVIELLSSGIEELTINI